MAKATTATKSKTELLVDDINTYLKGFKSQKQVITELESLSVQANRGSADKDLLPTMLRKKFGIRLRSYKIEWLGASAMLLLKGDTGYSLASTDALLKVNLKFVYGELPQFEIATKAAKPTPIV